MNEETSLWRAILEGVAASATVSAAAWGAMGGATSALVIRVERKAVVRQIATGALVAGGVGTAGMALLSAWVGVPTGAIPATGAASAASYLIGVFGPAVFEVILRRLQAGRMPGEGDGNG